MQKRLRIKPQSQFTLYDAKQNQGKHTPFNKKILFYPRKKNKNCNQKIKKKIKSCKKKQQNHKIHQYKNYTKKNIKIQPQKQNKYQLKQNTKNKKNNK